MAQPTCCCFEHLNVNEIVLDVNNPRIAKWIEIYGDNPSADQIALALGAGASYSAETGPTFLSLKQSIRTNGGIIHPIIVNRKSSGETTVIEGNTRLKIYLEFESQNVPGNWKTIPAVVYNDLEAGAIDAIRLQAHLVGVRQWDPFSKAKYLNHLRNCQHLTMEQIVDYCGGDKREVINYIDAYNDMENCYSRILDSDQDFDPTRFSAFVELQSPRVLHSLVNHGYTKEDFAKWVHERKLYPLNTVRRLPQILDDKKAKSVFLSGDALSAVKLLDAPSSHAKLDDLNRIELVRELIRRINSITYEEIQDLKQHPESEEVESLLDLKSTIQLFCQDISAQRE